MPTYELVVAPKSYGAEVYLLRDGAKLIRLFGMAAEKLVAVLADLLVEKGAAEVVLSNEVETHYRIDPRYGGAVASYLLMVRKSRSAEKWMPILRGILEGRYPGLPESLEKMVEVGIVASEKYPYRPMVAKTLINPKVADALGSGIKRYVEKYVTGLDALRGRTPRLPSEMIEDNEETG